MSLSRPAGVATAPRPLPVCGARAGAKDAGLGLDALERHCAAAPRSRRSACFAALPETFMTCARSLARAPHAACAGPHLGEDRAENNPGAKSEERGTAKTANFAEFCSWFVWFVPMARIAGRGRVDPENCRGIRWPTSGSIGRPARPEPRDKGRLGRLSDPASRRASEVRAGRESDDADACRDRMIAPRRSRTRAGAGSPRRLKRRAKSPGPSWKSCFRMGTPCSAATS
jgi:hypothetical protein